MRWIKLHLKLKNWGWSDDPNMVALWVRILMEANWKDEEWHGVVYEKGSFPTSYAKLSQDTGISVQTVRTCLERLKKSGEVTCVSTSTGTKIIVNKWDFYQGQCDDDNMPINTPLTSDQHTANTEPTQDQHTANMQLTTLIEDKNNRRVEIVEVIDKKNKKFTRPSIEEVETYCNEIGATVDPQKWYDYYEANGWKVGKNSMKDWKACIRNWNRNSYQPKQKGMVNILDL